MPRIAQNAEKYAVADFQKEIRKQQGAYNVMSVRSLAAFVGIPHANGRRAKGNAIRRTEDLCRRQAVPGG